MIHWKSPLAFLVYLENPLFYTANEKARTLILLLNVSKPILSYCLASRLKLRERLFVGCNTTNTSIDCNEQRVSLCGVEEGEVRTAGLHWRTVRPGLAGNDWGSLRTEEAGGQTEEAILSYSSTGGGRERITNEATNKDSWLWPACYL